MRLVIADDEYLVQESLISMIAEFPGNWRIVGVASDGNELVDLIVAHKPDLAIVDIRMPYISGLEAIRMTRQQCPLLQWIVLTGYSEFTFAQEALKLGATNYLLKPVDRRELQSSLETTQFTLKTQIDQVNKRFESSMLSICHGLGADAIEEVANDDFAELSYNMFVFYVDSSLNENEQANHLRAFYKQVKEKIVHHPELSMRSTVLFTPTGDLALITGLKKTPGYIKVMDEMIQELTFVMEQAISGNEFCLTMIWVDHVSFSAIKEQLDKLQSASVLRTGFGVNKKWKLNDLLKNNEEHAAKLCQNIVKLVKCYHEDSHALYMNRVNEFKYMLDVSNPFLDVRMKKAISHFLQCTILCKLGITDSMAEWIQKLKEHGQRLLVQIPKIERPQDMIQQTLLFIENNYMNEISILQLADELQVTPNYLSTLFHKKMGTTFIKYLTRIRLIKAQELLKDPNSQVQTVAEMVGYTNPRYFTKLFTEFVGCYPSDYKKSVLGNVE